MVGRQEALGALLRDLKAANYAFVAVTPATHARVVAREAPRRVGLRDIFGWSLPFEEADIDPQLLDHLRAAGALDYQSGKLRSRVRVASLDGDLFLHSAFPTDQADAVFFGPDTYRFTRFVAQNLSGIGSARGLVDMGSGSGAAAIVAAKLRSFERLTMIDMNPAALELAQVNADVAGVAAYVTLGNEIPEDADIVIANPPYMIDQAARSYRDGGNLLGGAVALEWARQGLERLAPGGTMLLYTGAAFVDGKAPLVAELERECAQSGAMIEIDEIDPDVFGEELSQPCYASVERIAALGIVIRSPHR